MAQTLTGKANDHHFSNLEFNLGKKDLLCDAQKEKMLQNKGHLLLY